MSQRLLIESLLLGKPYFGDALKALQGLPIRHGYMRAIVEKMASLKGRDSLNVLEIGSWAGTSAVTWGNAVRDFFDRGKVVCVDPWEPYIDVNTNRGQHYQEMDEALHHGQIYKLFLHNIRSCNLEDIVSHIIGASKDTLKDLEPNSYDVIFVDGSHQYKDVLDDFYLAFPLLADGGILCGDDLELQAADIRKEDLAMDVAGGEDYMLERQHNLHYHPGVTCAVGEFFGKVSVWDGLWAMKKEKNIWRHVNLDGYTIKIPDHLIIDRDFEYIETVKGYNVFADYNKLIAVSSVLGQVDLTKRLSEIELFPYLLSGRDRDDMLKKIEEAEKTLLGVEFVLIDETPQYNIIKTGQHIVAVAKSMGNVDLRSCLAANHIPPFLIKAETLEAVHHQLDLAVKKS